MSGIRQSCLYRGWGAIAAIAMGMVLLVTAGCGKDDDGAAKGPFEGKTLLEARQASPTHLVRQEREGFPPDSPPPQLFQLVRYDSPAGKLAAYVTPSPRDGRKHPAIIWISGGFSNSIGAHAWEPASPDDDQSASQYRSAGIVMMYPSLRGGNDNPGVKESFFGEVDDVLAAAEFLARQDYVDPSQIYLGGHSTGGTLVLLAAACSDRFRAVFSFGPCADPAQYGVKSVVFPISNEKERILRAPVRWLDQIQCPTFIFEGTEPPANTKDIPVFQRCNHNPKVAIHSVPGGSHFSILAPLNTLIAQKILSESSGGPAICFSPEEIGQAGR